VPGGPIGDASAAIALAKRIGAPLLVKAVGGGGGRGMKRVERIEDLPQALELAAAEAGAAFGDARVYLERYVARGRHVEVQVLGDGAGQVIHLGERDCSVQRRYQKLIEGNAGARSRAHAACRPARGRGAIRAQPGLPGRGHRRVPGRHAARRVLFPRDECAHPGRAPRSPRPSRASTWWSSRSPSPRVAGSQLRQQDVRLTGCAIECRINAEDPSADFQPSPGTVLCAAWPAGDGVRVDTHIQSGSRVPPFYDSLMGKIIAHGTDRPAALARLRTGARRDATDRHRHQSRFPGCSAR
jgi:acetyl-CoA carboxylase biotin carboxylase subunit